MPEVTTFTPFHLAAGSALSSVSVSYTHLDVYKRQRLRRSGADHACHSEEQRILLLQRHQLCPRTGAVSYTHLDVYKRQAKSDAAQRIAQEGRTRALLGRRADLFIVENAADSDVPVLLCRKRCV